MPWQTDGSQLGKYKYHPGGDPTKPPKEAPSALHSVIVPNVNLPKVSVDVRPRLHSRTSRAITDHVAHDSLYTINSISGARMNIEVRWGVAFGTGSL